MSSRIYVYCLHSIDGVDDEAIRRAIEAADLYAMAEELELDTEEDPVEEMLAHLVVRDHAIEWMASRLRVDVYEGAIAKAMILELLEELQNDDAPALARIRSHLGSTVAIASIETHIDAAARLDGVLADVVARHYAAVGGGLIDFCGG